jgi:hypothetical protein
MKQEFVFEELSDDEKRVLLTAFGYQVDENRQIIDSLLREPVRSEITRKPLTLDNAAFLPGSLKVTDSDPLTISRYLRERIEDGS